MRVLVTGASGFLGSHIAELLSARGDRVRCLLRAQSSTRYLPTAAERVVATFDDAAALQRALAGVEAVIHAAGVTRARAPLEYLRANVAVTAQLAEAAAACGVRRLVFISSLAARGPDGGDGPLSLYGASKLAAEQLLWGYRGALELVILRPAGVYGPRDRDFLPLFQLAQRGLAIVSTRNPTLQLVHAADVARACAAALEAPVAEAPLAIAAPEVIDQRQLTQLLAQVVGRRLRALALAPAAFEVAAWGSELLAALTHSAPRFDRRRARDVSRYRYTCDPLPAERALGWRAQQALPAGLQQTYAWYRAAGWL